MSTVTDSVIRRYENEEIEDPIIAGGYISSTMNMTAYIMGAGTVTIPFIFSLTGIVNGTIMILIGALVTLYASVLLVKCTQITGLMSYEEFAIVAFKSERIKDLVSLSIIISILGFIIIYITFAKTIVQSIAQGVVGTENLDQLPIIL